MTTQAHIAGGGPHDGADFEVPSYVIGVVFISRDADGKLTASLSTKRDESLPDAEVADALLQLLEFVE